MYLGLVLKASWLTYYPGINKQHIYEHRKHTQNTSTSTSTSKSRIGDASHFHARAPIAGISSDNEPLQPIVSIQ